MIRQAAAKELAQAILGAYVERGYALPSQVEQAALLIQKAVEVDELAQRIVALERAA